MLPAPSIATSEGALELALGEPPVPPMMSCVPSVRTVATHGGSRRDVRAPVGKKAMPSTVPISPGGSFVTQ